MSFLVFCIDELHVLSSLYCANLLKFHDVAVLVLQKFVQGYDSASSGVQDQETVVFHAVVVVIINHL